MVETYCTQDKKRILYSNGLFRVYNQEMWNCDNEKRKTRNARKKWISHLRNYQYAE